MAPTSSSPPTASASPVETSKIHDDENASLSSLSQSAHDDHNHRSSDDTIQGKISKKRKMTRKLKNHHQKSKSGLLATKTNDNNYNNNNKSTATSGDDAESVDVSVAEVRCTHDNVLSKFRSSTSEWAEYYQTKFLEEAQQLQQQATPLLSTSLKEKLRLRRLAQQQLKAAPSSADTAGTEAVVEGEKATAEAVTAAVAVVQVEEVKEMNGGIDTKVVEEEDNGSEDEVIMVDSDDSEVDDDDSDNVIDISDDDDHDDDAFYSDESDEDDDDDNDDEEEEEEEETRHSGLVDSELDDEFISLSEAADGFLDDEDDADDDEHMGEEKYYDGLPPWASKPYKEENLALRLQEEIIDFYNFIKETEEERLLRDHVIQKYTMFVKQVERHAEVNVFGSYAMDLMIPGSDLDVAVDISSSYMNELAFLSRLEKVLRKQNCCERIYFVRNARVPVLKFVDKATGHPIDVSCRTDTATPAINTVLRYQQKFPAMRYLVMVLKYLLKQRNLNDVAQGGLGSYALALLVVSHLQMHTSNFDSEESKKTTLGTLLMDFLALYGIHFNFVTTGISIRGKGSYYGKTDTRDSLITKTRDAGFCIHVTDPNDSSNNVTRSSFRVEDMRACFRSAFGRLISFDIKKQPKHGSLLSRIIRINDEILYRPSQVEAVSHMLVSETQKWDRNKKKLKKKARKTARFDDADSF